MKTMRTQRVVLPLALLSAAFMLACQDQGLEPMGLDGIAPQFAKKTCDKDTDHPSCKDGDDTKVTWSFADARVHGAAGFVPDNPNTLQSNTLLSVPKDCSGFPGARPSNPTVEWNDGEGDEDMNGCAQVTTTGTKADDGVTIIEAPETLTNDALLIVGTKKGTTKFTIQFQIQDEGGFDSKQYRTDKFVVDNDLNEEFTEFTEADGFTLHVHKTVTIYRLKGHTGGPKDADVGTINIDDIVYN